MFDDLLDTLGQEIGNFLDTPVVRFALQAIAFYIVVLWAATAYWAYRDLQSRTTNPVAPYLAAALIIVFTPLFFVFGVIVYRILRPAETVAEANERSLAEEAMMTEIEAQPHCANCSRQVHEDWIICPTCRNRLRRVCPNCNRLVELDWSLCAWCGKDFERPELLQEVAVPPPVRRPLPAPDLEGLPAETLAPEPDQRAGPTTSVPAIPGSLDARASERNPRPATGEH